MDFDELGKKMRRISPRAKAVGQLYEQSNIEAGRDDAKVHSIMECVIALKKKQRKILNVNASIILRAIQSAKPTEGIDKYQVNLDALIPAFGEYRENSRKELYAQALPKGYSYEEFLRTIDAAVAGTVRRIARTQERGDTEFRFEDGVLSWKV